MASPFPVSFSKPGEGHLIAHLLPHGISALTKATFQYPLKIITPPSPAGSQKSALAFLLTYGGGLVGGDQVNLKVRIDLMPYRHGVCHRFHAFHFQDILSWSRFIFFPSTQRTNPTTIGLTLP